MDVLHLSCVRLGPGHIEHGHEKHRPGSLPVEAENKSSSKSRRGSTAMIFLKDIKAVCRARAWTVAGVRRRDSKYNRESDITS